MRNRCVHRLLAGCIVLPVLVCGSPAGAQAEPKPDELIDFNPPPELELNLLIQMVSDELSLKVLYDEKIGNQKVKLLVPEQIPRSSMRGILESSLRMKGFALVEGDQPGWLQVVEARNLINIAPAPEGDGGDGKEVKPTEALTRVFKLEHYDPQKAEQVIKPYLTEPGGNLQVIAEQRLVIVTDYSPRVARIEKVLDLIDQPRGDVSVRFHNVVHMDAGEASSELTRVLQARLRAQSSGGAGDALGLEVNPEGFTAWLAGAGVKPGYTYGATDALGYKAVDNVCTVHDLHATILHLLGLNHERLSYYNNGIERRLTDVHGHVIKGILQ